jgi:ABC-type nitrate/sulfonate/bicarbonate transport system substrate-binding protein
MKKLGFSAVSKACFAALAAAAVGLVPAAALAQAKPDKVTVRYGYLPVPTMPMFAAIAHDLLEKEGVDLQLIKFTSGPAAFQALQSGSIDAAQGGMFTYYMGTTRGLEVRWIYNYGDYGPLEGLVVPGDSKVRDYKEMRGKRVAAPSGSMMNLAHLYALRKNGMTLKDVEFVPLQPPQGLAAVVKGEVDGAWFWDPLLSQAMQKGAKRIINNKELGLPDPFGIAMTTKFLSEKRNVDALGRMLRAFAEGQRRYPKDPERTLSTIQKIAGIDRELSLQIIKGCDWFTVENHLDPEFLMSMANPTDTKKGAAAVILDRVEEPALWGGMITKRGNVAEYLDNRPVRLAAGK